MVKEIIKNGVNWWMIVAIAAIVLLLFGGIGASGFCGGQSGYGMMSWRFGAGNGLMGSFMVLFWVLIVFFIVWIINHMQSPDKLGLHGRRVK